MLDRIIFISYCLIFFLVPLVWSPLNYELFEFNKMMLTYLLTVIIVGAWLLKMVNKKSLIFNRTPLDIPLLLFLAANILSTIFSIDVHTSIWGYYSRLNGGLLSTISYLLLYFGLVSNLTANQVIKLLKIGLAAGVVVSIWGIVEHIGISPSCVILRGELNDSCWIQDVKARVFATLGQPNWMAAYLAMLIFPSIYFAMTSVKKKTTILYAFYSILIYGAFTFTFSRGATLGLIAGIITFLGALFLSSRTSIMRSGIQKQISRFLVRIRNSPLELGIIEKSILIVLLFLLINLFFGSALSRFPFSNLFNKNQTQTAATPAAPAADPLESGTDSGKIRLIVWQGALDIFRHYPIFGSGVETFAYSYYQFRPAAHNLVSEWDFLYNKAHNEFLNYLATTGILGFSTYMAIIITFLVWSIKLVIARNIETNQSLKINRSPRSLSLTRDDVLLIIAVLGSYISYLVQNFFSFSVVIIAIMFYLFPAIAFVTTGTLKPLDLKKLQKLPVLSNLLNLRAAVFSSNATTLVGGILILIFTTILSIKGLDIDLSGVLFVVLFLILIPTSQLLKRNKPLKVLVVFLALVFIFKIATFWYADTLFAKGESASDSDNPGGAYNFLSQAVSLNPHEPFYLSELSFTAASSALALSDTDATTSAQLKDQAISETSQVLRENPKNTSYWRTAIKTYFELSGMDKAYYQKTLDALDHTITLAPTDPKLYYNKAIILGQNNRNDEAIKILQDAIKLKPDYSDAYYALALFQFDKGQKEDAVLNMNTALKFNPGDSDVLGKLNEWGKQGISTKSGSFQ